MSVSLEYYKVFYYVAKYKKISLAAEMLYVSQPAVTQIIQKLEEQLGGNLFVRNKSGIELTEIGKKLYDFTSSSIEILENAEYRLAKYENLEEGSIKIRSGSSVAKLLLYNAIESFSKDYPNIKLDISTGVPSQSIEMLHKGEIDLVFIYLPYDVEYSNLEVIECAKKEYIFAMSKNYYKNNNVKISKLEDINNYSLILPRKNSAIRNMFDDKFKNIQFNAHYELTHEEMKKDFIMKDLGIGFIIRDEIEEELKSGDAIEVKLKDARINGSIGVVTLKKELATFATNKLLEYMK